MDPNANELLFTPYGFTNIFLSIIFFFQKILFKKLYFKLWKYFSKV